MVSNIALHGVGHAVPAAGMWRTSRPAAEAAGAAAHAAAAVAAPRERRIATATVASVNRGTT